MADKWIGRNITHRETSHNKYVMILGALLIVYGFWTKSTNAGLWGLALIVLGAFAAGCLVALLFLAAITMLGNNGIGDKEWSIYNITWQHWLASIMFIAMAIIVIKTSKFGTALDIEDIYRKDN